MLYDVIFFCDVTKFSITLIKNDRDDDDNDDKDDNDNDDGDMMTFQFLNSISHHRVGPTRLFLIHTVSTVTGPLLIHKCFHGNRDLGSLIESLYHLGNRAKGGA